MGDAYDEISARASEVGIDLPADELADLAEECGFGEAELSAVLEVLGYASWKAGEKRVQRLLRGSRLPSQSPKTFELFDFSRIQGRDADALRKLPTLSNLYARKNIAFIGPGGIGKTHLAQAYGRACCLRGYRAYYLKANELRDKLAKAARSARPTRCLATLTAPECLIVDEVGRCRFDKQCTDLFFHVVDKRYEKEGPNTLILTSNTPVDRWDQFFTGDETLSCTLDRVFDRASVFMMAGTSHRGAECVKYSVQTTATVTRARP